MARSPEQTQRFLSYYREGLYLAHAGLLVGWSRAAVEAACAEAEVRAALDAIDAETED